MILLARKIICAKQGGQDSIGGLDAVVRRNAFGSQVHSCETELSGPPGSKEPYKAVFIRAPVIDSWGDSVQILGRVEQGVVAARQENILVTSFHPELTDDTRWHEYFLHFARGD